MHLSDSLMTGMQYHASVEAAGGFQVRSGWVPDGLRCEDGRAPDGPRALARAAARSGQDHILVVLCLNNGWQGRMAHGQGSERCGGSKCDRVGVPV